MSSEKTYVSVDIGNNYTKVYIKKRNIENVANEMGNRCIPTMISYTENEKLYGNASETNIKYNEDNTIYNFVHLIGRTTEYELINNNHFLLPKPIVTNENTLKYNVKFKNQKKEIPVDNILKEYYEYIRKLFVNQLGSNYLISIITPYQCDPKALEVFSKLENCHIKLIPENISTLYSVNTLSDYDNSIILLLNISHYKISSSIIEIKSGIIYQKEGLSDFSIGPSLFDDEIVKTVINDIDRRFHIEITKSSKMYKVIKMNVIKLREILSVQTNYNMYIESLIDGIDYTIQFSRNKYNDLNIGNISKISSFIDKVLELNSLSRDQIDLLIPCGGGCNINCIKEFLYKSFKKVYQSNIPPEELGCYGGCIAPSLIDDSQDLTSVHFNFLSYDLFLELQDNTSSQIFHKNQMIPNSKQLTNLSTKSGKSIIQLYKFISDEKIYFKKIVIKGFQPNEKLIVDFNINQEGKLSINIYGIKSSVKKCL